MQVNLNSSVNPSHPKFEALKIKKINPEHKRIIERNLERLKGFAESYDVMIKSGTRYAGNSVIAIPVNGLKVTVAEKNRNFLQKLFGNKSASSFFATEYEAGVDNAPNLMSVVHICANALK